MGAHFTPPELADLADVRRDLLALIHAADERADERHRAEALARYMRRQLEAAAEIGAAMLAALGLPRLVEPGDFRFDPVMAGDALDLAIATLDALDGDTDLEDGGDDEPSLGWRTSPAGVTSPAGTDDREQNTADDEPPLAAPERHPTASHWTAPWSWVDTGPNSSQQRWAEGAQHDREAVNEDGDDLDAGEHDTADHESYLGWPEDIGSEMSTETAVLTADPDAEHDDVDREDDELDADCDPEPVA